jgi:uncharacterized protein YgbK (DUF1537 family)
LSTRRESGDPEPGGPLLGAVADDVTGATDLCSTLVAEGMRTIQTIGVVPDLELPGVAAVVVALKSRTAPVDEAVTQSRAALAWLRELGARQFFFKVCSTFDSTPDGNIGPVADALLDDLGADLAVVCPAYPTNGRTVYQGHLFVGDRLLSESSMARHPLTPMTDPDLVRVLGRQAARRVGLVPLSAVRAGPAAVGARLDELRRDGVSFAVADAVADEDLRTIGAAAADLPLVVGGSGVALGLPENFRRNGLLGGAAPPEPAPVHGPAVVLAGSCSAATQEQVRRMAARHPAIKVDVLAAVERQDGADALSAAALAALGREPVLVYSTSTPDEVTAVQQRVGADRAGAAVETLLGEVAKRLVDAGARRVVVAGGETSGAVMRALGVRALAVGPEIAPGVPWMTSLGEPRLALALKSGNFGGPDFFLEAVGEAA